MAVVEEETWDETKTWAVAFTLLLDSSESPLDADFLREYVNGMSRQKSLDVSPAKEYPVPGGPG